MPNRADLMSCKGLDFKYDMTHTRTQHFREKARVASDNLATGDIDGKFSNYVLNLSVLGCKPRVWAPKEVNKQEYSN